MESVVSPILIQFTPFASSVINLSIGLGDPPRSNVHTSPIFYISKSYPFFSPQKKLFVIQNFTLYYHTTNSYSFPTSESYSFTLISPYPFNTAYPLCATYELTRSLSLSSLVEAHSFVLWHSLLRILMVTS